MLSLVISRSWPVHQLDVKNAFLHCTLSKTIYYSQPTGFVDPTHPDRVCLLNKSVYELKQAPQTWYSMFTTYIISLGFVETKSDTSLFVFWRGTDTIYLLLYVDDIVRTASSATLLQHTISALKREFIMKNLGPLHFLGVSIQRQADGLFLTQCQFALDILERAGMVDCKPVSMPVDTQAKDSAESRPPIADPTHLRSLAGALQYLTLTRPDIAYVVQQICLHMHDPQEPHLAVMKHTMRYLRDTLDYDLLSHPEILISECEPFFPQET
jgi:hypothetical protein